MMMNYGDTTLADGRVVRVAADQQEVAIVIGWHTTESPGLPSPPPTITITDAHQAESLIMALKLARNSVWEAAG